MCSSLVMVGWGRVDVDVGVERGSSMAEIVDRFADIYTLGFDYFYSSHNRF